MDIITVIKSTPFWFAAMLLITTFVIGIYVGAPIAVNYYNLTLPNEVVKLFVLMTFGYFYWLIPLCYMCAEGLKLVRKKFNMLISTVYVLLCIILVPIIFYGIGISNYYR